MTDAFKNLNYAEVDSDPHRENWHQIESLLEQASADADEVAP
jgi:hypothetical protein